PGSPEGNRGMGPCRCHRRGAYARGVAGRAGSDPKSPGRAVRPPEVSGVRVANRWGNTGKPGRGWQPAPWPRRQRRSSFRRSMFTLVLLHPPHPDRAAWTLRSTPPEGISSDRGHRLRDEDLADHAGVPVAAVGFDEAVVDVAARFGEVERSFDRAVGPDLELAEFGGGEAALDQALLAELVGGGDRLVDGGVLVGQLE